MQLGFLLLVLVVIGALRLAMGPGFASFFDALTRPLPTIASPP